MLISLLSELVKKFTSVSWINTFCSGYCSSLFSKTLRLKAVWNLPVTTQWGSKNWLCKLGRFLWKVSEVFHRCFEKLKLWNTWIITAIEHFRLYQELLYMIVIISLILNYLWEHIRGFESCSFVCGHESYGIQDDLCFRRFVFFLVVGFLQSGLSSDCFRWKILERSTTPISQNVLLVQFGLLSASILDLVFEAVCPSCGDFLSV